MVTDCAQRRFVRVGERLTFYGATTAYHTSRLAFLSFSAAGRFSDDFDLRFPFGKQHWDWGEFMPIFLNTGANLFMFGVQFPAVIEAVTLWRHRHEPIAHGPRKCASVA